MARNYYVLEQHLGMLQLGYPLTLASNYDWFIAHGFWLPPGFDQSSTDVLVEIPSDYPLCPPGVSSSHIYVEPELRFRGRRLADVHEWKTPGWGNWAWFCFRRFDWDPMRDDLVKVLEVVRLHLTDPPTE